LIMNELKQIIQAYRQFQSTGISCVLATLVKVRGSHYRKAGLETAISLLYYWIRIKCCRGGIWVA